MEEKIPTNADVLSSSWQDSDDLLGGTEEHLMGGDLQGHKHNTKNQCGMRMHTESGNSNGQVDSLTTIADEASKSG